MNLHFLKRAPGSRVHRVVIAAFALTIFVAAGCYHVPPDPLSLELSSGVHVIRGVEPESVAYHIVVRTCRAVFDDAAASSDDWLIDNPSGLLDSLTYGVLPTRFVPGCVVLTNQAVEAGTRTYFDVSDSGVVRPLTEEEARQIVTP
jgi:hypothetical protein